MMLPMFKGVSFLVWIAIRIFCLRLRALVPKLNANILESVNTGRYSTFKRRSKT